MNGRVGARRRRHRLARPHGRGSAGRRTSRRRRTLGQHFLIPGPATERAVADFSPSAGEPVLEIGPGRGALTRLLLAAGTQVLAVELDADLARSLESESRSHPNLRLICADVLGLDLRGLLEKSFGARSVRVLSSLPYSSGTAIVEKICDVMPPVVEARVLLQEEVVERIAARPGAPQYGYLSVVVTSRCSATAGVPVRPGAFNPPPRVQSRWLALSPLARPPVPILQRTAFLEFVGHLFRHPRKTLANNLRAAGYGAAALAAARDIGDVQARPGTWSVERFAALHACVPAPHSAVLE